MRSKNLTGASNAGWDLPVVTTDDFWTKGAFNNFSYSVVCLKWLFVSIRVPSRSRFSIFRGCFEVVFTAWMFPYSQLCFNHETGRWNKTHLPVGGWGGGWGGRSRMLLKRNQLSQFGEIIVSIYSGTTSASETQILSRSLTKTNIYSSTLIASYRQNEHEVAAADDLLAGFRSHAKV